MGLPAYEALILAPMSPNIRSRSAYNCARTFRQMLEYVLYPSPGKTSHIATTAGRVLRGARNGLVKHLSPRSNGYLHCLHQVRVREIYILVTLH